METWVELPEFPGYSVSNHGRIRNDNSDRIMALVRNQHGIVNVGLMKDGRQRKRSVALLVATEFLERPDGLPEFNTPIHLDGDKMNNRIENLMWRPLWFAVKYHAQFGASSHMRIVRPIREIHTNTIFPNSYEAAVTHGLLERDISLGVINKTYVFPTYQVFEFYND